MFCKQNLPTMLKITHIPQRSAAFCRGDDGDDDDDDDGGGGDGVDYDDIPSSRSTGIE